MKKSQRGGSLLGNIAKCGLNMGTKTLFKKRTKRWFKSTWP